MVAGRFVAAARRGVAPATRQRSRTSHPQPRCSWSRACPALLACPHTPTAPAQPACLPTLHLPAKLRFRLVSILSRGDDEFAGGFCGRLEDEYAVFKAGGCWGESTGSLVTGWYRAWLPAQPYPPPPPPPPCSATCRWLPRLAALPRGHLLRSALTRNPRWRRPCRRMPGCGSTRSRSTCPRGAAPSAGACGRERSQTSSGCDACVAPAVRGSSWLVRRTFCFFSWSYTAFRLCIHDRVPPLTTTEVTWHNRISEQSTWKAAPPVLPQWHRLLLCWRFAAWVGGG